MIITIRLKIEVIKASEAPPPPPKMTKQAAELFDQLTRLKKDELLRLTPDDGKTVRGLKTSIGRIASNGGVRVESYDIDGVVYVKKL